MRLVLDASMAMSWYFLDESDETAEQSLREVRASGAFVPAIWPLEILNILAVGERRGRSTPERATEFLLLLDELEVHVQPATSAQQMKQLLDLARKYEVTVYDATYLYAALELNATLMSRDTKMIKAALGLGITIYTPQETKPS